MKGLLSKPNNDRLWVCAGECVPPGILEGPCARLPLSPQIITLHWKVSLLDQCHMNAHIVIQNVSKMKQVTVVTTGKLTSSLYHHTLHYFNIFMRDRSTLKKTSLSIFAITIVHLHLRQWAQWWLCHQVMDCIAFEFMVRYITGLGHFTHPQTDLTNKAKSTHWMDHKQHKPDWPNHRINIVTRALWIQFMRNLSTSTHMLLHTNICMKLRKKKPESPDIKLPATHCHNGH